jgi:beta-lactamase class A
LPLQKIAGVSVGLLTIDEASIKLQETYGKQTIRLVNNDDVEIMSTTFQESGIAIDVSSQVREASNYPLWQRLIPFSAAVRMFSDINSPPHVIIDDGQTLGVTSGAATNAEIIVQNDQLSIKPSQVGFTFETDDLRQELSKIKPSTTDSITIKMSIDVQMPNVTTAEAQKLASQINQRAREGLMLTFENQFFSVDKVTLLSWLTFLENAETKGLEMQLVRENLEKYANDQLAPKTNIATKNTVINTYNSLETSRINGANGRAVNIDKLLADVNERLSSDSNSAIKVETVTVAAKVTYNRSYSGDFAGLRHELTDRYAGKAYAISVIDLTGKGNNLSINATRVFTAASTYKLYVAYSMLLAVESGEVTWDTPLNGTTLAVCFDRMIVNSDNDCPKAWLNWKTYQRVTQEVRSIGAGSTCLGCSNGQSTTTQDLANFLNKIYNGSILTADSRARLIDAMKRNVYRQGIPKGIGVNGTVADKVGFLNGLLHDAAIVYSNKGNYIMVIMTDGSSWGSIAETAQAIYQRL